MKTHIITDPRRTIAALMCDGRERTLEDIRIRVRGNPDHIAKVVRDMTDSGELIGGIVRLDNAYIQTWKAPQ